MEEVAVFMRTTLPQTAIQFRQSEGASELVTLWYHAERHPTPPASVGALLLLYLLLAFFAHGADRRAAWSEHEPSWMRFTNLVGLVMLNVKLYHSLVRIFYAAPGWTKLTTLQSLTLFVTKLLVSAEALLLFLGVRQCTPFQTLSAALFSSLIAMHTYKIRINAYIQKYVCKIHTKYACIHTKYA